MASSFTVKIGADTKQLLAELKKADKQINATQKSANNLAKSLDFEYDELRATQAQKQFQKALEQTEASAQKVRDQLKKLAEEGKIGSVDYSALELELAKTESKAVSLRQRLEEINNIKIEQLTQKFTDVGDKITQAGQKLTAFSLAAGGMIAGAAAIGKSAAKTGAELDDLSLRFGISAETIQEWQYVAVQCGVDAEVFNKALIKMRAAMADLSTGTINKAAEALQTLGINPDQFETQEEMFDGIVAALAEVKDATLQTALANEIFGDKIATQMLPYINTGTDAIQKFKDEFAAMPSLSNEQVAALAELDDTYYRLSTTMKYATAQLGLAFAPVIERVIEFIEERVVPAIEKLADWFEKLDPGMQDAILGILGIVAVSAPLLMVIGRMSAGIGSLIKLFKNLHLAQLKTAAGFAAIMGAAGLAIDIIANWKKMSWLEVLLKGLGVAALAAAAAVTVFHASWSLGFAVAAIGAAVAGGLAIIKAATKDVYPEEADSINSQIDHMASPDMGDYTLPQDYAGGGNTYSSTDSNDVYNVNITIEGTNLSAEEIAEAVSKKIATTKQSRG